MTVETVIFSSLTNDFEIFETHELLNWNLHGVKSTSILVNFCLKALPFRIHYLNLQML